jgi:Dolichyl-phosphate-mannose-protein mannosyltransferase
MTIGTLSPPGAAGTVSARLLTPRGFFVFLSLVMVALWLIRSLAFPATGGDDSEQIVFAQYLAIGYFPRNPPLFTWLVIAAQQVFGVSVLAVASVKFAALWGSCATLFVAARMVLRDERFAVLTGLSPLAMSLVTWNSVIGLTDTTLVMFFCVLTFVVFLRLRESGEPLLYIAMGVCAGLGLISKYGYGIFLLSLLFAALFDGKARGRLLAIKSLMAVVALVIVVTPYAMWFNGYTDKPMATDTRLGAVDALRSLASAVAGGLAPLWVVMLIFFPFALRAIHDPHDDRAALRRLIGIQLVGALALFAVVVLVSGLKARVNYMFVLILLPLYFFARVQAAPLRERAIAWYGLAVAAIAVGATAFLAGKAYLEPLWCTQCERHLPFDAWSREIAAAGFERGTIVGDWWPFPIAGNMKVHFPQARVVSVKHPLAIPPARHPDAAGGGSCLLLWGTPERRSAVIQFANVHLGARIDGDPAGAAVTAPIRFTGNKHEVSLYYLLVKNGAGQCR